LGSKFDGAQLPLQYKWTLWYNAPSKSWDSKEVVPIGHFATIREFWRLFNNIKTPSHLESGSDYHVFKGKVKPEWEDEYNLGGGTLIFRFSRQGPREIDRVWFRTLLAMVGHTFTDAAEICGLVASIRKGGKGKICIWLRNAEATEEVKNIALQFKSYCEGSRIDFQTHAAAKTGSKMMEEF
jgi:translation initiation factor 4E